MSATNSRVVSIVQERAARNPKRSMRKVARELAVSTDSIRRIIKDIHGLRSLNLQRTHFLDNRMKNFLPRRFSGGRYAVLFTVEKLFKLGNVSITRMVVL